MLRPGTKIDSYTVVACIGAGGGGSVYKCNEAELNRVIALKLLASDMLTNADSRERFEREAKILCTIKHPNVTQCYKTGMYDATTPFIAMEFVEGRSLQSIIDESNTVPWITMIEYAVQMCNALGEIHAHGIVHRDLKPDNFMLSTTGVLKLVDFGLAHITGSATLTETGLLLGTVYYMSPESCIGHKVDARADIYALGCTLYYALFGRPPFDGDTPLAIIHQHANATAVIPSTQLVPKALVQIISKCLAKNPDNRFQSAEQVLSALRKIQENAGEFYTPDTKRKRRFHPAAIVTLVTVAILVPVIAMVKQNANTKSEVPATRPAPHKIPKKMRLLETVSSISTLFNSSFLTNADKIAIFRDYVASDKNKDPLLLGIVWHRLSEFSADNPLEEFHCRQESIKYLQRYLDRKQEVTKESRSACIDFADSLIWMGRYPEAKVALRRIGAATDSLFEGTLDKVFETQHLAHLYAGTGQMVNCRLALMAEQETLALKGALVESSMSNRTTIDVRQFHSSGSSGMRAAESQARLAVALAVQGKVAQARKAAGLSLDYAQAGSVKEHEFLPRIGDICMTADYPAAEKAYRSFLKPAKSRDSLPTRIKLTRCLMLQQKFEESNPLLESLQKEVKASNLHYMDVLQLQIQSGDLQGADTTELCSRLVQSIASQISARARVEAWFTLVHHYQTTGNTAAMSAALTSLSTQLRNLPFSYQTDNALLLLLKAGMPAQMLELCESVVVDRKSQFYIELQLYKIQALALQHKTEQARALIKELAMMLRSGMAEAPRVNAKLLELTALHAATSQTKALSLLERALSIYETNSLILCPDHFAVVTALIQLAKEQGLSDLVVKYEAKLLSMRKTRSKFPPFENVGLLPLWR
ncbi:MAG: protein kinase [Candidatus Obscuribacterales bacterium]|nr:protein kinase [Candidatus Obscuribacterales bacterium]